jgi:hypothetical protein
MARISLWAFENKLKQAQSRMKKRDLGIIGFEVVSSS